MCTLCVVPYGYTLQDPNSGPTTDSRTYLIPESVKIRPVFVFSSSLFCAFEKSRKYVQMNKNFP